MDKKTYEALKRIVKEVKATINLDSMADVNLDQDVTQVEGWIDEVAKEYD